MRGSLRTMEYERFLKAFRKAREDKGLTQEEVAKMLKRPQSYVSKCESGERRVDVIELAEFAKIYGKSLDYFVRNRN